MKIIIVTPSVPLPFGNTAARWFYVLIKELLDFGHTVVLFNVSEDKPGDIDESRKLLNSFDTQNHFSFHHFGFTKRNYFRRKISSFLEPFSEVKYADGLLKCLNEEMKKGYDILHFEQLWTGWLGLNNPKALLNIHHFEIIDWEDKKLESWKERKTYFQMKRATKKILLKSKNIRVFTDRLYQKAKEINPKANYWTVPFSLDLSLYPPQPLVNEPVIGLFGSMHWDPTRSAAIRLLTKIWPLIKKQKPEAKLFIAGWNATKYLNKYLPLEDVTLEENLKHPTDFFSKTSVMVYAPSKGSGFKVKILESMAYGVPVVTTWEGVEGLEYENGTQCFVEEENLLIAERVISLLNDAALRKRISHAARNLLETSYNPIKVASKMVDLYKELKYE